MHVGSFVGMGSTKWVWAVLGGYACMCAVMWVWAVLSGYGKYEGVFD